ncbi:hypothetical protein TWF281_010486 [Arthrobotrys megalospora]
MPCKAHVYPHGRFELWLNHPTDQIYFRLWERFIQDQHTKKGRKRKWVSSYFGYKVRLTESPNVQGRQQTAVRVVQDPQAQPHSSTSSGSPDSQTSQ